MHSEFKSDPQLPCNSPMEINDFQSIPSHLWDSETTAFEAL